MPKDMATEILPLVKVAHILAEHEGLPSGKYAIVVEFKLGNTLIGDSESSSYPGMAVGIGGIGLKKTEIDGPLTFSHTAKRKRTSPSPSKEQ